MKLGVKRIKLKKCFIMKNPNNEADNLRKVKKIIR